MSHPSIGTLVLDIYKMLESSNHNGHSSIEEASHFAHRILDKYTATVAPQQRPPRDPHIIWASELGKPCLRKLCYDRLIPEKQEPLKGYTLFKFLYGDLLEELTLEMAKAAGHTVEDEQRSYEIPFTVHGVDVVVRGRTDAKIDGHPTDIKSASGFAFKQYCSQGVVASNDKFGYRRQLAFYKLAEGNKEQDYFLFVSKELGKMALIANTLSPVERDPEHLLGLTAGGLVLGLQGYHQTGEDGLPPRLPTVTKSFQNEGLGMECGYCAYKQHCWPGLRAFAYSKGPEFLTNVKKEPNVPELSLGKLLEL